jgi:membrane protein YqaA with SNARE-associated domain
VAGIYRGYRLQGRWLISKDASTVTLAGEWFTMAVLMTIFWVNFANGTVQAVAPEITAAPMFLIPLVLLVSVASGSFTGRAVNVVRAAHGTA